MELAQGPLYSEDALSRGITTDIADLTLASLPHRVAPRRQTKIYEEIRRRDRDLYERLEKVGFLYHFGEDGAGIHAVYMRRGSGYYIDVGASELVANGDIKLRSGVSIAEIRPRSVVLTEDALTAYLIGEAETNDIDLLDDVDAVHVVEAHLQYFEAIGAVGPQAPLDDVL